MLQASISIVDLKLPETFIGCRSITELAEPDVFVQTSGGLRISAHAGILASASPVLENVMDQRSNKHSDSEKVIKILGVPCHAVTAFVGFLYFSRCTEEQIDQYGMHLLALSHVYLVPQLKQRCIKGLIERLSIENVVDVLQLARLCDAPDLYLKCMKLLTRHFKAVEATEGWKFLEKHDPWLELEILQFMDDAESRKKRTKKHREEMKLYTQLSEAMNCLEHIFREGCTDVRPCHVEMSKKREPCDKYSTCQGLQLLIRHFATCKKRVNGGCLRCKRMWQLLRLHSSICESTDSCTVPLCRNFKLRQQQETKNDHTRWKILARKVVSAKVMCSLSSPKMKETGGMSPFINKHVNMRLSTHKSKCIQSIVFTDGEEIAK